nr:hypothetical protein [Gordonia sp. LAM0048]
MPNTTTTRSEAFLRFAAWAFLFGWGLHVVDHMWRGMSASPTFIMAGGMIQGVIVVVAIVLALSGHSYAPDLAIVAGIGSALVFTYAHLLPNIWPGYQDSFVSGPRVNVTWFSWVTALAEIGTGLLFAYAGGQVKRARRKKTAARQSVSPTT